MLVRQKYKIRQNNMRNAESGYSLKKLNISEFSLLKVSNQA